MGRSLSKDALPTELNSSWERKMKTFFRRLDSGGVGYISKATYEAVADRYISLAQLDKESVRAQQVRRKWVQLWEDYLEEFSTRDVVDEKTFVKALRTRGPRKLFESCYRYGDMIFDLVDVNGNGVVSKEEFVPFWKLFNVPDNACYDLIFSKLVPGIGVEAALGDELFLTILSDYFTSNSIIDISLLFGPLIDH